MQAHIDDEPITIQSLLNRLLDLGGQPSFTIAVPNIGSTLSVRFASFGRTRSPVSPRRLNEP